MKKQAKALIATGAVASLGLAAVPVIISATGVSGTVRLNAEVATAIAMKIASPNDTNPDCMEQSGVTYGVANRYATSNGAEGSKQVDTFDGTPGGADEVNTNTSCATLTMNPNAFSSTYSDITIYTNSPNGYSLTVRSADNTSPNLVNTTDPTQYIEAGALTEADGTGEQAGQKIVLGGQNKWALKSDTGLLDTWTPVATTETTVRAYDQITNNGSNTRVTYGISSGNNPVGKYATTLTYTATMFDSTMNPDVPTANFAIGTGSGSGNTGSSVDPTAQITVPDNVTVPYKETRTVPVEVAPGYYIDSVTCENGYECTNYNTGDDATGSQTIDITNNTKDNSGSIDITTKPIEYPVTVTEDVNNEPNSLTLSTSDLSVPYGQSRLVTVTPATGYYLAGVSCADGYICTKEQAVTGATNASSAHNADSATLGGLFTANAYAAENDNAIETGEDAYQPQTIKITNNNTLGGGSISFATAPRHFTVAINKDDNLSILGTNGKPISSLSIAYGHSEEFGIVVETGHYLESFTCPEGYRCVRSYDPNPIISPLDDRYHYDAGEPPSYNITVYNEQTTNDGTIAMSSGTTEYTVEIRGDNVTTSTNELTIPYGGSKTLTVTPDEGYYLSEVECPLAYGYTCTKEDGSEISTGDNATAQAAQTIKVTNNNTTSGGSLTFTGALRNLTVAITPSIAASTDTNSLSVPYGGSKTFTITPNAGYYLTGITCSTGYTCSTPTYGSAADSNAASRGAQTITVTNNSTTSTGAVSFTLDNKYRITLSKSSVTTSPTSTVDVPYGSTAAVTITPSTGYYLNSVTCPSGYTCSGYNTGQSYTSAQTLTIKNNSTTSLGTLTLSGDNVYTVTVSGTKSTVSASSLSIPYGGSKTVDVTPESGAYFSSQSCPSGYTCSGAETGVFHDWEDGKQTITVKNDNTAAGGTLELTSTTFATCSTSTAQDTHCLITLSDKKYHMIKLKDDKIYTRKAYVCNNIDGLGRPSAAQISTLLQKYGGVAYSTSDYGDYNHSDSSSGYTSIDRQSTSPKYGVKHATGLDGIVGTGWGGVTSTPVTITSSDYYRYSSSDYRDYTRYRYGMYKFSAGEQYASEYVRCNRQTSSYENYNTCDNSAYSTSAVMDTAASQTSTCSKSLQ